MAIDDRDVDLESIDGWFRATGTDEGTVRLEYCVNGLGSGFYFNVSLDDARRIALAIDEAVSESVIERDEDREGWQS